MKKGVSVVIGILLLYVGCSYTTTSYFRTPLSFIESRFGYVHYPFWLDIDTTDNNSCSVLSDRWEIDTMGVLYQRNACKAFGKNAACIVDDCSDGSSNGVTRDTVSLSQLWFGKESFLASDIFANATVSASSNPFLPFVSITPDFAYQEEGAAFALNVVRKHLGCDKTWFVGGRVAMQVCTVEVNQRHAGSIEQINADLDNVVVTVQQQLAGQNNSTSITAGSVDSRTVRAYRLDFLSLMQLPDGTAMVQYGDLNNNTLIAGQDITTNMNQYQATSGNARAPMYLYKQANGIFPLPAYGLDQFTAIYPQTSTGQYVYPMVNQEAADVLPATGGATYADGQLLAFGGSLAVNASDQRQDYLGSLANNVSAQKQLFLVPVMPSSASSTFEPVGLVVQNTIDYVFAQLQADNSLGIDYFYEHGIDFETSDCSTGAGDTFLDFYGGKMCECWFADALIGFRLPTGTDADNPKRIYKQTTGNNGHFATKLGAEGGYMPCDWFGIKLDFFWRYNLAHNEKRAAAFKGSKTRNIGPCIDASVHWNDFQAHVDFTFFSPKCPNVGWDLGYEFYAKTNDGVSFCRTTALDFNGNTNLLDASILEKDTDTQSHKVRAEMFNRWGCFELFVGGSYIIAGRQVMKETECHIGLKAYF